MPLTIAGLQIAMLALLVVLASTSLATPIRAIDFVASDFRTQQDDPTDVQSFGDPFGIFGLTQPDQITGSFVFDLKAVPWLGPTTGSAGDPEYEYSEVFLPYLSFTIALGPGVVLTGAQSNFGDTILIRDGVGTRTTDNLWVQSLTDQQLAGGIQLTSMQIQLFGAPSLFSGLDVPSVDVYNAMADSMIGEKLRIQMLDAQGNFHSLVAFELTFFKGKVPEPSTITLLGVGVVSLVLTRRRPRPANSR